MASQEGFSTKNDSLCDETNYAFCIIRMQNYLMALGFDIWKLIVTGYIVPTNPPIDADGNNSSDHNENNMNSILSGLSESKFVKVMHCKSEKDIWVKLQNIYENDDKVKKEKLQTHRR
jgi:hypothetical protein